MLYLFIKSIFVGLAIAAIIGPISILCIRIGLTQGMRPALIAGMGAATADGLYGLVAAFGLISLDNIARNSEMVTTDLNFWLPMTGACFMLYLTYKVFRHPPETKNLTLPQGFKAHGKSFFTVFMLTLSNPMTILSFIGVFAGLGITTGENSWEKTSVVFGVFLGSTCWWILLSLLTNQLRRFLTPKLVLIINKVSGLILFTLSASIIIDLMNKLS